LVAAIWLGPGPVLFGWEAIGADTATATFGSAAAGGNCAYSRGWGLGLIGASSVWPVA
jgi:hypothetical protein